MSDAGLLNEAELRAMVADPRYWRMGHPECDTYVSSVTAAFQRAYPAERSSGGKVHVRAHTRVVDGKSVQVAAHERAAPPGQEALAHGDGSDGTELAQAQERPNADHRTNLAGRELIIQEEGQSPMTRRLHWPGDESGVTIGFGYDFRYRSASEIAGDLRAIGVAPATAQLVSRGAGLSGRRARDFAARNRNALALTDAQRVSLFERILPGYEDAVRRAVNVRINSNQFSALVSFAFNAGPSAMRASSVVRQINADDTSGAARLLETWGRPVARRMREADLFRRQEGSQP